MTGVEGSVLGVIERLYAQWLAGEIASEDVMFRLGDLLGADAPSGREGGVGPPDDD